MGDRAACPCPLDKPSSCKPMSHVTALLEPNGIRVQSSTPRPGVSGSAGCARRSLARAKSVHTGKVKVCRRKGDAHPGEAVWTPASFNPQIVVCRVSEKQ